MSDKLRSWLRTIVPAAWAALITWLALLGLPDEFVTALDGLGPIVVVPAILAAIYAGLRALEPHLPEWLARILLGGSVEPSYAEPQGGLAVLDSIAAVGRQAENHAATVRAAAARPRR